MTSFNLQKILRKMGRLRQPGSRQLLEKLERNQFESYQMLRALRHDFASFLFRSGNVRHMQISSCNFLFDEFVNLGAEWVRDEAKDRVLIDFCAPHRLWDPGCVKILIDVDNARRLITSLVDAVYEYDSAQEVSA